MDDHDDLPEKIRHVLLALEGRVSAISDRLNHVVADRLVLLDASIRMLADGLLEVSATVNKIHDQLEAVELVAEVARDKLIPNTPPPIAKPAQSKSGKPARRVA
jgi:hypothetical protein